MERPFAVIRSRAQDRRAQVQHSIRSLARFRWLLIPLIVLALFPFSATPTHASAQLWLPTPPGERWKIIQGYGCGTHNSWDRYAFDLVSADGKTYGAPARAAAEGTVFVWEGKSGTIIIRHADNLFTQYTHLATATVRPGDVVRRGDVIGTVGDRGTKGNPHLHFHAFMASGAWASNRKTIPLSFAEGYDFAPGNGCSQHQNEVVVAGERAMASVAGVQFSSEAQGGRWYNHDVTVAFGGTALARGWSAGWTSEPNGDAPAQTADAVGQVQLAAAGQGLHTLHVRGWDQNGQQTVATFGPIGYDVTAPVANETAEPQIITANTADAVVRWNAAQDAASGVAGYRVYLGADANGTSEWFVPAPETLAPALAPGSYTLRVQPIDFAGNIGAWTTVGQVVAQ